MVKKLQQRLSPSMIVSLIALFVALGGTTYAATGGTLFLGQPNSATSQTGLTSNNAGKALQITQQSTGTGATALGLNVPAGKAPFTTNSGTKVANLNADKLDGIDSTGFLGKTSKAADSNLLDGQDSSAFLPANGKAADSDLLDGIDSSGFTKGEGQNVRGAAALAPNDGAWMIVLGTTNPTLMIGYLCPTDLGTNGDLLLTNGGDETVNVFSDDGGSDPVYLQLGPNGGSWHQSAAFSGEQITFAVQGEAQALLQVNSVHRSTDCHVQVQGILTR